MLLPAVFTRPRPHALAITGRIDDWMNDIVKQAQLNPTLTLKQIQETCDIARLPVSCTTFVLQPGFYTQDGIMDLLRFTSKGLRFAAGVAVHLNNFALGKPSVDQCQYFIYTGKEEVPEIYFDGDAKWITVNDSMEESTPNAISIEDSWEQFFDYLDNYKYFVVDLSNLRPAGTDNGKGLVASGAESFAEIYEPLEKLWRNADLLSLMKVLSAINSVLRRGGIFKNGAVNAHIDYENPQLLDFLEPTLEQLGWIKRTVNVDEGFLTDYYKKARKALYEATYTKQTFIMKKHYDKNGERLYGNVCIEVLLNHTGTCLLSHVNLGKSSIETLAQDIVEVAQFLISVHPHTGIGQNDYYLSPETDRQIGVGFLGLANLLAIEEISYADFLVALQSINHELEKGYSLSEINDLIYAPIKNDPVYKSFYLAIEFIKGIDRASALGRIHHFDRMWAIAPTANCSFNHRDADGFTTTPEIGPPVAQNVERRSATTATKYGNYGDVETAASVGWKVVYEIYHEIAKILRATGLFHSISMDWYNDQVNMGDDLLTDFILRHANGGIYYSRPTLETDASDKTEILTEDNIDAPRTCSFNTGCDSCG